jgi:hypothetical protein
MLYADRTSEDEELLIRNQKYEYGGQLKVKIDILFYGNNS